MDELLVEVIYGIEYKMKGQRKWRTWDDHTHTSVETASCVAEDWWGPKGHRASWRIVEFERRHVVKEKLRKTT